MNLDNIFNFLNDLKINNNREWFQENKKRYEVAKNEFDTFTNLLIAQLKTIDLRIDVFEAKN